MKTLQLIFQYFFNLIFPKQCFGCKKSGSYLCENCRKTKILKIYPQTCFGCGTETEFGEFCEDCRKKEKYLDGIMVFYEYEEPLKTILHKFKYGFKKDLSETLSELFLSGFRNLSPYFPELVFISPVPLHKKRFKWRGFNQSEVLAKSLINFQNPNTKQSLSNFISPNLEEKGILHTTSPSQEGDLKFFDCLERIINTKPQVGLSGRERKENIKDAFSIKESLKNKISGKIFLVVDDVVTTGSTLRECAKVLKENDAKLVFGVCLVKG